MTFTYKTTKTNGYSIELYQEKFESVFHVAIYPVIDEDNGLCGYPVSVRTYENEKTANKGFNQAVNYYGKL